MGGSGDVKLGREYDVWEPAFDGLGMYNPQTTSRLQNLDFSIKTNILKTIDRETVCMLYLKINYKCMCVYHCVVI
jgi:hypothetical protein